MQLVEFNGGFEHFCHLARVLLTSREKLRAKGER